MARGEHIGGPFDASTRLCGHCAERVIKDCATFDFNERQDAAAPGDQVNLTALGAKAARHDTVPFQSQNKSGGPFRTAPGPFSASPRRFSTLRAGAHDFFRSFNARS